MTGVQTCALPICGMKIKRENVLYDEAYDPVGFEDRIYKETDKAVGEEEVEVIQ